MNLTSRTLEDGARIPDEHAFCLPDPDEHVTMGDNVSPHLAWSDVPDGTRSFAVVCVDPDVPSVGDDVNEEGRTVPAELDRVDFYHWILVDVPPSRRELEAGLDSDGITARGKELGQTDHGVRGRNDYTGWFEGDDDMEGVYGGYDGPCPPWNDERIHHYHFRVYALDVATLGLSGEFGGDDVLEAIQGHVLGEGEIVVEYTLNQDLL